MKKETITVPWVGPGDVNQLSDRAKDAINQICKLRGLRSITAIDLFDHFAKKSNLSSVGFYWVHNCGHKTLRELAIFVGKCHPLTRPVFKASGQFDSFLGKPPARRSPADLMPEPSSWERIRDVE